MNINSDTKFWIALSGGVDSRVLLDIASKSYSEKFGIKFPEQFGILHINHNIQKSSNDWEKFCKNLSIEYKVDYKSFKLKINQKSKESLEEQLRRLRREKWEGFLSENNILLLGQHQDDQVETCLYRFLRGTGPKGLAGMPFLAKLGKGYLMRPLLDFTKDDLISYAVKNNLKWVVDHSNKDIKFDRNFLRNDIIPKLKQRWVGLNETITRNAKLFEQQNIFCESIADKYFKKIFNSEKKTLFVGKLLSLDKFLLKLIIRKWLYEYYSVTPSFAQLEEIENNVLKAKQDSNPKIKINNIELARYRDEIYVISDVKQKIIKEDFVWKLDSDFNLDNINIKLKDILNLDLNLTVDDFVTVKFKSKGEKVKKIFQENNIPVWLRSNYPAVFYNDKLIFIPELNFN